MRKVITVTTMVVALALGMMAPAMANNSARSTATPVELGADDVNIVQFGEFSYVAIDHNLGDQDCTYTYREAARLGGQTAEPVDLDGFNTLYLGVSAPDAEGNQGEIFHKGQVSVYYDCNGETQSIVAQFNGKGEILHVNGIKVD